MDDHKGYAPTWAINHIKTVTRRLDQQLQDYRDGKITRTQLKPRFTSALTPHDIRTSLDAHAVILYVPRDDLEARFYWRTDTTFGDFHARYLVPQGDDGFIATASVEDEEGRPGIEVFDEFKLTSAGAVHIVYPEDAVPAGRPRYQIALLTPTQVLETLSGLYAVDSEYRGWHPLKGHQVKRINVEELRGKTLAEVVRAAVDLGCHEVSTLDLKALYPERIHSGREQLHLKIEYPSSSPDDISNNNNNDHARCQIHGAVGSSAMAKEWAVGPGFFPQFHSSSQPWLRDVVWELGGLGDFEPVIHVGNDAAISRYYIVIRRLGTNATRARRLRITGSSDEGGDEIFCYGDYEYAPKRWRLEDVGFGIERRDSDDEGDSDGNHYRTASFSLQPHGRRKRRRN